MILNVDGSNLGYSGVFSFGGLVRNANGGWVHNFTGNINYSNILHAKVMVLYHGICMALWVQLSIRYILYDVKTRILLH